MGSRARGTVRIVGMWLALGALLASVIYLNRSSGEVSRGPVRLGEIDLLATATFFDEGPSYTGQNNLLRGNFIGSLGSTDPACIASRDISFFRQGSGSAPDLLVAVSISDTSGTTGNFTSSEWHDPPGVEDTYYAVVAADEAKNCETVRSDPIVVN